MEQPMPRESEAESQPSCPNPQPRSQLSQLHLVQHKAHTEVLGPTPLSSCLEPIMSPEEAP